MEDILFYRPFYSYGSKCFHLYPARMWPLDQDVIIWCRVWPECMFSRHEELSHAVNSEDF